MLALALLVRVALALVERTANFKALREAAALSVAEAVEVMRSAVEDTMEVGQAK